MNKKNAKQDKPQPHGRWSVGDIEITKHGDKNSGEQDKVLEHIGKWYESETEDKK